MTNVFATNQFLIIGLFLIVLIGLMMLVRRFKAPLASQFSGQRRIKLVEDTAISSTERIKLVMIDNAHYAIVTTKNQQPVIMPIDQAEPRSKKPASPPRKTAAPKAQADADKGSDTMAQPFLQAMKNARIRNPLLGFDK